MIFSFMDGCKNFLWLVLSHIETLAVLGGKDSGSSMLGQSRVSKILLMWSNNGVVLWQISDMECIPFSMMLTTKNRHWDGLARCGVIMNSCLRSPLSSKLKMLGRGLVITLIRVCLCSSKKLLLLMLQLNGRCSCNGVGEGVDLVNKQDALVFLMGILEH